MTNWNFRTVGLASVLVFLPALCTSVAAQSNVPMAGIETLIEDANQALAQDKRSEALAILHRTLKTLRDKQTIPRRPASILAVARLSIQLGEGQKATSLLLDHLHNLEQLPDAELGDEAFQLLITVAWANNDFENALKWTRGLFARYETRLGPNNLITLDTELNLGVTLIYTKDAATAQSHLQHVVTRLAQQPDRQHYFSRLNSIANSLNQGGFLKDADGFYDILISELEKDGPKDLLGISYFNKAVLQRDLGQVDVAVKYHKKSIDILSTEFGDKHPTAIMAIAGLGQTYNEFGQPAAGLSALKQAFDNTLEVIGENNNETWIAANNYADALRTLEQFEAAEKLDRQAYEWRKQNLGLDDINTEVSSANLALDLMGLRQSQQALELFKSVYERRVERLGKNHPDTLSSQRGVTLALIALDQPVKIDNATFAPEQISKMGYIDLNLLAGQFDQQGNSKKALELYLAASIKVEETLGTEDPTTFLITRNYLRALRSDNPLEAVKAYIAFSSRMLVWSRREFGREGKPDLGNQVRKLADGIIYDMARLALEEPRASQVLAAASMHWKSAGTLQQKVMQALKANPPSTEIAVLISAIEETRSQLDKLKLKGEASADAQRLRLQIDLDETILSQKVSALKNIANEDKVSMSDIVKSLKSADVLIDYIVVREPIHGTPEFAEKLFVQLVTNKGVIRVKDLGSIVELRKLIEASDQMPDEATRKILFKTLFGPILKDLKQTQNLYIVPDDVLYLVPFDGLLDDADRPLIDRYGVHMLRNMASIKNRSSLGDLSQMSVLLVGNPAYAKQGTDEDWMALPYAGNEVEQIEKLLFAKGIAATRLSSGVAKEDYVKTAARGKSILHFATHGFFLPVADLTADPLWYSGIGLVGASSANISRKSATDGVLHSAEIVSWQLGSAELVVLSACVTAKGTRNNVDGLRGFPSALAVAGAKRSLLALWEVDDQATSAFMARFYELVVRSKGDYEAALVQTKRETLHGEVKGAEASDVWQAFVMFQN